MIYMGIVKKECFYHKGRNPIAQCSICGKYLCELCAFKINNEFFCPEHATPTKTGLKWPPQPPSPPPIISKVYGIVIKSHTAFIVSFIASLIVLIEALLSLSYHLNLMNYLLPWPIIKLFLPVLLTTDYMAILWGSIMLIGAILIEFDHERLGGILVLLGSIQTIFRGYLLPLILGVLGALLAFEAYLSKKREYMMLGGEK